MLRTFIILFLMSPIFIFCKAITIIGDSNSYGFPTANIGKCWSRLLDQEFKNDPDVIVKNYSHCGATTSFLKPILEYSLEADEPDLVFLCVGVPDAGYKVPLDKIEDNLEQMIQACLKKNVKVLIGRVDVSGWIQLNKYPKEYLDKFNTIHPKLIEKYNLDSFDFINHQNLMSPNYNVGDNVHPNANGQYLIYLNALKALNDIFF